jgi:hypothetical protein
MNSRTKAGLRKLPQGALQEVLKELQYVRHPYVDLEDPTPGEADRLREIEADIDFVIGLLDKVRHLKPGT